MTALPDALASYFAAHVVIPMPRLCELLPMDAKTLRRHIDARRLVGRIKGEGRKHPRRVFTAADVAAFLEQIAEPCPSIETPARPTGNLISRSKVIAFPVPRGCGMNVTRRPSRTRAARKPAHSSTE